MSSERARAVAYAVQYLIRCTGKSAEHDTEIAAAAREVLAEKLDALIAGPPVAMYFGQPYDERTMMAPPSPLAEDAGRFPFDEARPIEREPDPMAPLSPFAAWLRYAAREKDALIKRLQTTVAHQERRLYVAERENARLSAMLSGKAL